MEFLDGRRYFVFGAGRSGRSVAKLLAEDGREVVVYDESADTLDKYRRSIGSSAYSSRISTIGAGDQHKAAAEVALCDRLVISPGVPLEHPLVATARKCAVGIDSEIEAAFHYTNARVVGVTGTNGKSTTVGVIGIILESAGVRSVVAGNIGTPFSAVVGRRNDYDSVVLELSSFQLDTITDFKADVAVLLNVTPDHLDRYHHSFDEYASSKSRVLNRSDGESWFVYNKDDAVCRRIAGGFRGNALPFSSTSRPEGANVVYVERGMIYRNDDKVLDAREFTPIGLHNLENAMAAVGVVTALGIPLSDIMEGLRSYRPLPHRMELVRVTGGVAYINDSKATNVDAAIKSVIGIDGGIVLIAGGRDKAGDFRELVPHMRDVRSVILIGEAANVIGKALAGVCELETVRDMAAAVGAASHRAVPGDTVLLAPACTSFDMFDNYEHRGEVFEVA